MKKILIFGVLLLLIQSSIAFAHPGRTDSMGGHTCKTNCEKWGLEYGEYHFYNEDLDSKKIKTEAKKEAKKTAKSKNGKGF